MGLVIEICTHEAPPNISGGPFVWAIRVPIELRKLGYIVKFKLLTWHEPKTGFLSTSLNNYGFEVSEKKIGYTEDSVLWMLTEFKKSRPNIVIISLDLHSYYATKQLKKAGIPVVGIIRSDHKYSQGLIKQFVTGKKNYQVSAMVSVSEYLTETIKSVSKGKILTATIPSGTVMPSQDRIEPEDTFRIVYVGRLVNDAKQILKLTESFINVTQGIKGTEAYLIGGGSEESEVAKIIEKSGCKQVHLLGYMESSDVVKFLLTCHVIVLLSDYEGAPTSVMEGMACGCVPVCLDIRSGIPELVIHEKTGLLVKDREQSFVEAIKRLKEDRELWFELSSNSKALIQENFTVEVCAKKWALLIEELCKNKHCSDIKVPRFLNLPKTNRFIEHHDKRRPNIIEQTRSITREYYYKIRIFLGAIKRKLI